MNGGDNNKTTHVGGQHVEAEDLMQYALELLSPEERELVERHLQGVSEGLGPGLFAGSGRGTAGENVGGCAFCRDELAEVRNALGEYALATAATVELPAHGRHRLIGGVAAEMATTHGASSDSGSSSSELTGRPAMSIVAAGKVYRGQDGGGAGFEDRTRTGRLPAWLGWAVAAAVAIAAVHYYQGREALRGALASQVKQVAADEAQAREIVDALTDRSAQRVTLSLTKAPAPPQPSGRATYLASRGTLIFLASHLDPLPAGKTYELWLIPAGGAAPIPAGTFQPDERGNASVVTAQFTPGLKAKAFGVTIEAEGGSPTPTLPIVLAGS